MSNTTSMNGYHNGTGVKKLNQFGDYEDTTDMTVEDWEHRWGQDQTQFHMPKVHPMLEKHIQTLTRGKKNLRIFLPLSGKSVDLKWLSDQGHEVVGCECADKGCKEFFEENQISYEKIPMKEINGTIYRATNGAKIALYKCDYFELTKDILGTFDCIWDRGSFVAIGLHLRQKYCDVIIPLMKDSTIYLLDCFLVDNNVFGGPPFNCDEGDVKKHFGSRCCVKKIDERDAFTKWQETWGITSFVEEVYFISPLDI